MADGFKNCPRPGKYRTGVGNASTNLWLERTQLNALQSRLADWIVQVPLLMDKTPPTSAKLLIVLFLSFWNRVCFETALHSLFAT